MSLENINNRLLAEIKSKLPADANLANSLMDILCIGKEAIYRRIRGEVPFTLYEAIAITGKLSISLDKIATYTTSKNALFELKPVRFYNCEEIDYFMLEEWLETLKMMNKASFSELAYACNIFPQYPTMKYDAISRFHSLKWNYLNSNKNSILPYHKMEMPEKYNNVTKETIHEMEYIKDTCYIWDNMICQDIVDDIKYFSSINLILDEDVQNIKKELFRLMEELEIIAIKGQFNNGNKVQIYISNTNFDTTYYYIGTDSFFVSLIGAFTSNYLSSLDQQSYEMVKKRIQSLKKTSTLISESGEIQRIDFFNKQRKVLDTL